jgi:hypothetical protein
MVVLRAPTRIQTGADAMNSYAKFGAMIATATLVMLGTRRRARLHRQPRARADVDR